MKDCPIPEQKPATTKGQVDVLWDVVTNHIWHMLCWQDLKINFILALLGIILALLALVIVK